MRSAVYLYILAGVAEIAAEFTGSLPLHAIAKPLLMPALIAFYIQFADFKMSRRDRLVVAALVFAWLGDVALMFVSVSKNYFLLGLLAFMITHMLYICAFVLVKHRKKEIILKRKPWLLLPLLAYFIGLLAVVLPAVGPNMKIPVAVYTSVIGAMVIFALCRYGRVSDSSFALVFGGAILFMWSDSLIAISKFLYHGTLCMAGVAIMALYIAGQYLIAKGMLRD
jgi:uncharacterized membrane protein YhhN